FSSTVAKLPVTACVPRISTRLYPPRRGTYSPGVGSEWLSLAVMAKAPRVGQVKTRLTTELSPQHAADLQRVFLHHFVMRLKRLHTDELIIAFDPPDAADELWRLFPNVPMGILPQPAGDLGE